MGKWDLAQDTLRAIKEQFLSYVDNDSKELEIGIIDSVLLNATPPQVLIEAGFNNDLVMKRFKEMGDQ